MASLWHAGVSDAPAAGARVGAARYILRRMVGRGEYTEVWLAWHVKREHEVALKFLPPALVQQGHVIERLDHEVRRSAQLAHPGIARVYELVLDHQYGAIATEYVEGWPLAVLKADRPQKRYRVEEILLWVHQICAALDYAHHHFCLVHRDLNPSNLLLNSRDQLKVTDFIIDCAVRSLAVDQHGSAGSPSPYCSPQQIAGAEPSVLDDIYALGATIYDLLTGAAPFSGSDAVMPNQSPPSMTERLAERRIVDQIPTEWEQVVAACLAHDPGQRPQSAGDVARALTRNISVQAEALSNEPGPTQRCQELGRAVVSRVRSVWGICGRVGAMMRAKAAPALTKVWKQSRSLRQEFQARFKAWQQSPRFIWYVTITLVALNLALALWFLLR